MSLAYFPLFPDDFEADTAHLTLAEDGAYNRLLRLCWRTPGCSIPDDRAWIYRHLRALSDEDRAVVDTILAEFFTAENGRFSNARLAREWLAANDAHTRRVRAGSKGGKSKALKNKDSGSSKALAKPKQPEPEPEPLEKEEPKGSSQKRGSRMSSDWTLPKAWGEWAVAEGMDHPSARREADRFRDYWVGVTGVRGVKRDWQATWRNWVRKALDDRRSGRGMGQHQNRPGYVNAGAFGNIREVC